MQTEFEGAHLARVGGARAVLAPPAIAALLSAEAGLVHLVYTKTHWLEFWGYGVLFLAAGVGQVLFAALVARRPAAWLIITSIACNIAIIGAYFLSRTSGLPFGPHRNALEPAGATDLVTTAAEVALVVILIAMLDRGGARRLIVNALLLCAALAWGLRLSGHLG